MLASSLNDSKLKVLLIEKEKDVLVTRAGIYGGFRYIFAAFLQESSEMLNNEELNVLSKEMTEIGDLWRDFALNASRIYKNRKAEQDSYESIAVQLDEIADREKVFFTQLKKAIK